MSKLLIEETRSDDAENSSSCSKRATNALKFWKSESSTYRFQTIPVYLDKVLSPTEPVIVEVLKKRIQNASAALGLCMHELSKFMNFLAFSDPTNPLILDWTFMKQATRELMYKPVKARVQKYMSSVKQYMREHWKNSDFIREQSKGLIINCVETAVSEYSISVTKNISENFSPILESFIALDIEAGLWEHRDEIENFTAFIKQCQLKIFQFAKTDAEHAELLEKLCKKTGKCVTASPNDVHAILVAVAFKYRELLRNCIPLHLHLRF